MKLDVNNLENSIFEIIDRMQFFFSQDMWDNILFNCTKNEMLILLFLHRYSDVNMSGIAEYLKVPLNTATGIVSRMEKKGMVSRVRSARDKRIVTIALADRGQQQIDVVIRTYMDYGQKLLTALSPEELSVVGKVIDKTIDIIQDSSKEEVKPVSKVRRIEIK